MRHGNNIIILLCQNGKLGNHHLELLWNSSLGKHESVKQIIFLSILDLIGYLNIGQLDYLYQHINKTVQQLKPSEFDIEFLQFLYNFTEASIQHPDQNEISQRKQWYSVDLLWRLSTQDTDPTSLELTLRSRHNFISLLRLPECSSIRSQYLDLAIENLKSMQSVVQSLALVTMIIDLNTKKQKSTIESLEQKHKILDLFFKEITNYKRVAQEKSRLLNEGVNLNLAILFGSQIPHLAQVQGRLEFLEYILSQSSLMLNTPQVDSLWDSFISNAITHEERELCFIWLRATKISGGNSRIAFPENVIKYIFLEKMSSLDWSHLGIASYNVFERYFFYINEKAGKIKKNQTSIFLSTGEMLSNQLGISKSQKSSPSLYGVNSSLNSANGSTSSSISPSSSPMLTPQSSIFANNMIGGISLSGGSSTSTSSQSNSSSSQSASPSTSNSAPSPTSSASTNTDFSPNEYTILTCELLGINYFWSIALNSINNDVCTLATSALITLYQSGGGDNQSKSIKYKEEFIKKCFENISKNIQPSKSDIKPVADQSIQTITKAVHMLKQFRTECKNQQEEKLKSSSSSSSFSLIPSGTKKDGQPSSSSSSSSVPPLPTLPIFEQQQQNKTQLFVKLDRGDSYIISDILGSDTLRMFKRKVAVIYGPPKPSVKSLKVYMEDKELKDDDKCLDDYKLFDQIPINNTVQLLVKRNLQKLNINQGTGGNSNNTVASSNSGSSDKKEKKSSLKSKDEKEKEKDKDKKKDKNSTNMNGGNDKDKDKEKEKDQSESSSTSSTSSDNNTTTSSSNNNNQEEEKDRDNDEEVDILDDTPVASIVIESLQHQMGGFGLMGDIIFRKVQEPKSKSSSNGSGKSKGIEDQVGVLLSKPSNFDQIFYLLSLGEKIAEDAWSLINDLPFNEKISSNIKALKEDLSILIPNQSTFNTLYSLKIIESILEKDLDQSSSSSSTFSLMSNSSGSNSDKKEQIDNEEFKDRFLKKMGVNYVVQIVLDSTLHPQKGSIKMIGTLLKNLNLLSLKVSPLDQVKMSFGMHRKQFYNDSSYCLESPVFIEKLHSILSSIGPISKNCIQQPQQQSPTNHYNYYNHYHHNFSSDIHSICQYGMELLTAIIAPRFLDLLKKEKIIVLDWSKWLKSLLLECPDQIIQIKTSNAILNMTTNFNTNTPEQRIETSLYFLSILLSYLPEINQYFSTAQQYFCLLSELINIGYPPNSSNPTTTTNPPPLESNQDEISSSSSTSSISTLDNRQSTDFINNLLLKLIKELKSLPVRERSNLNQKDHILVGILNIIRNLLRRRPSIKSICIDQNLLEFLFYDCLFKTPTADDHGLDQPPLCKVKESRVSCFRLLRELSKNDFDCFFKTIGLITNEINSVEESNFWNYSPIDKEKSPYGYVGLKNQGATCYMNSLLQQLYCSPILRKGVMSLSLGSGNKSSAPNTPQLINNNQPLPPPSTSINNNWVSSNPTANNNSNGDCITSTSSSSSPSIQQQPSTQPPKENTMLVQLQLLFIYLQESSKSYYDPINFCKSIKNFDGTDINLGHQMDAYEFFLILLDKLEEGLKDMPQKSILKESFGGVLTNQFLSKDCSHEYRREEPFCSISLEVKNKKSLLESFLSFADKDYLVGDNKLNCEHCGTRVDATKRCLIDKLPNTLIIHLKRFEYDLDNMRNNKVNDFCEFPMMLDMEPYTLENAEFKEKGIIPPSSNENYLYQLSGIVLHQGTADYGHYISLVKDSYGNWFELNDTTVRPYDPSRIPLDCFGGIEEVKEIDKDTQKPVLVKRPKSCNAYMLFYSKVYPNNNDSTLDPVTTTTNGSTSSIDQSSNTPKISIEALETVWDENRSYLSEIYLYDIDFSNFVWDIVNLNHNPSFDPITPNFKTQIIQNPPSPQYQSSILASIKLTTQFIVDIYSHSKEKSLLEVWAFHLKRLLVESVEGTDWLISYLAENRTTLKNILMVCHFEKTRSIFVDIISFTVKLLKNSSSPITPPIVPSIIVLYNSLISLVKFYKEYPRKSVQQFFTLLLDIIPYTEKEREFLLQRGIITKLIDTYIGTFLMPNGTGNTAQSQANYGYYQSLNYNNSNNLLNNGGGVGNSNNTINTNLNNPNTMLDLISYLVRCCQISSNAVLIPSQFNNYPSERDKSKPGIHIIIDNQTTPTTSEFRSIQKPSSPDQPVYIFSESTFFAVLSKCFLIKLIKEYGWNESTKSMIKHLCWENKAISTHFLNVIKESLVKNPVNTYPCILPALSSYLEINDSIIDWRIEQSMTSLLKLPESMIYIQEGHDAFIKYLSKITGISQSQSIPYQMITNDHFQIWKQKNKDHIMKSLKDAYRY
eukprot:gene3569-4447_t